MQVPHHRLLILVNICKSQRRYTSMSIISRRFRFNNNSRWTEKRNISNHMTISAKIIYINPYPVFTNYNLKNVDSILNINVHICIYTYIFVKRGQCISFTKSGLQGLNFIFLKPTHHLSYNIVISHPHQTLNQHLKVLV